MLLCYNDPVFIFRLLLQQSIRSPKLWKVDLYVTVTRVDIYKWAVMFLLSLKWWKLYNIKRNILNKHGLRKNYIQYDRYVAQYADT